AARAPSPSVRVAPVEGRPHRALVLQKSNPAATRPARWWPASCPEALRAAERRARPRTRTEDCQALGRGCVWQRTASTLPARLSRSGPIVGVTPRPGLGRNIGLGGFEQPACSANPYAIIWRP